MSAESKAMKAAEGGEVVNLPERATPMSLLEAAIAKGVDPDTLEKLMDLQERWEDGQAKRAFESAMARFQADCPTIKKNKQADRYTYSDLPYILGVIRPILSRHGLSVRFSNSDKDAGWVTATCIVSHEMGHREESQFFAPVDERMKVNETQKMGSANSYCKRYALANALNLVFSDDADDDDGYAAGTALITDEQAADINALIEEVAADPARFFRWCSKAAGREVTEAAQIPARIHKTAVTMLERKRGES